MFWKTYCLKKLKEYNYIREHKYLFKLFIKMNTLNSTEYKDKRDFQIPFFFLYN